MNTTWRMRLGRALILAMITLLPGAGCVPDLSEEDADEVAGWTKDCPTGITKQDLAEAISPDLRPGAPWEATTSEEMDPQVGGPDAHPLALTTINAQSWAPLSTGQSKTVTFTLSATESMAAYAEPYDEFGDIDLELYKGNAGTASWSFVKSSVNGTGYIDSIFTPPYTSGWEGTYSVKLYCRKGPCNFGSYVTKGDDQDFNTLSVYLNQRSFKTNTNSCTNAAGAWVADGECMCSDASAAMALVAGGKRRTSELTSSAQDLFDNTNYPDGGANRSALMDRLKANYGYAECSDLPLDEANIRFNLRYKSLVLLRSPKFSDAGHYVQVRGYKTEGGVFKVRVNDPYGAWSSKNVWSPPNEKNSTGYGQDSVIQLSLLQDPGASLVVCK